mmetsp:Transcript_62272/g.91282  ORF Transcript_62272/g.91282 Transcript_62272/m.91282 type:complete len:137 (+) Transcript_62272:557-967(+)
MCHVTLTSLYTPSYAMYMHVHKSRDIQIRVDERSGNNEYYIPTSASMRGVQKHAMYAAVASLPSDAVRLAVAHGPVPFSDVANSQQYDTVGGDVSTPLPLLITRLQALDQHEHEGYLASLSLQDRGAVEDALLATQ